MHLGVRLSSPTTPARITSEPEEGSKRGSERFARMWQKHSTLSSFAHRPRRTYPTRDSTRWRAARTSGCPRFRACSRLLSRPTRLASDASTGSRDAAPTTTFAASVSPWPPHREGFSTQSRIAHDASTPLWFWRIAEVNKFSNRPQPSRRAPNRSGSRNAGGAATCQILGPKWEKPFLLSFTRLPLAWLTTCQFYRASFWITCVQTLFSWQPQSLPPCRVMAREEDGRLTTDRRAMKSCYSRRPQAYTPVIYNVAFTRLSLVPEADLR